MKKICCILLICVVFLLASCSDNEKQLSESVSSISVSSSSIPPQYSVSSQEEISKEDDLLELQLDVIEDVKSADREIEANEIRHTFKLGKRVTIENALPSINSFEYPYFYYSTMTTSDESSTGKGGLEFGRYSLETNKKDGIGFVEFQAQSDSDEAGCVIDDKYLITSLCTTDDNGNLIMNIVIFDIQTKTKQIVYSDYSGNVFSYLKQVAKDEIVLFYYSQKDLSVRELTQKIVKYNIVTKETKTIFEGNKMSWETETSTKDIWAMDVYNDNIYLILHQFVDGGMKTFLRTIDKDGNTLSETKIDSLEHYSTKEQTIYHLTVEGDYIFVNYFTPGRQPPSAILKWDGNKYSLFPSTNVNFKELLTPTPVDGRYVYFNTYFEKADEIDYSQPSIFIFDLQTQTAKAIKIEDTGRIYSIDCDSSGNVLVASGKEYVGEKLYLFNKENILSQ